MAQENRGDEEGRRVGSMLIRCGFDILQRLDEVAQNFGRHHDGIAIAAHVFGDFDDHAARIFLEINVERFAICDDFFCM